MTNYRSNLQETMYQPTLDLIESLEKHIDSLGIEERISLERLKCEVRVYEILKQKGSL